MARTVAITIPYVKGIVAKIYDWFIADFGGNERSVLRATFNSLRSRKLLKIGKLSGQHYDWSINAPDE